MQKKDERKKGETRCKKEGEFWVKLYHIHVRRKVKKMSWVTGEIPEHVYGLGRCGSPPQRYKHGQAQSRMMNDIDCCLESVHSTSLLYDTVPTVSNAVLAT